MPLFTTIYSLRKIWADKSGNGEITVIWKPKVCIHSTLCWKGRIEVFNPKVRPWIKIDGATTEKIFEQVRRCPSGALNYFLNNKVPNEPDKNVAESASILKVEVTVNGLIS
jgi:uncharacterized Fe-S cluster protein YjdI